MTWFGWFLIGWLTVGGLLTVGSIGDYRKPVSPAMAVGSLIVGGLMAAGVLFVGTGSL